MYQSEYFNAKGQNLQETTRNDFPGTETKL